MSMTPDEYKAFMEEYFKNNHIPDRDRHKWDSGTKQLLGISEKSGIDKWIEYNKQEQEQEQKDARDAYLFKTGNPDYFIQSNTFQTMKKWAGPEFADNTKYLPPPEPEEEPDYPLHRMCEDCYKERYAYTEEEMKEQFGHYYLSEQEPCHYCFNPTRFTAGLEENRTECSFLHLEREDDE